MLFRNKGVEPLNQMGVTPKQIGNSLDDQVCGDSMCLEVFHDIEKLSINFGLIQKL